MPVTRTFFDMSVRASGPILNRIWNTNNGFAEKIKHTFEPWVFFNKFTNFDTFDQIIAYDSSDYLVPDVTRITYGLNNRLYARRTDENPVYTVKTEEVQLLPEAAYQLRDRRLWEFSTNQVASLNVATGVPSAVYRSSGSARQRAGRRAASD